jgi:hypothetical protein
MSTIEITYDGVDISTSVIFASASFESQLGAVPGAFEFTVKDLGQTHSFIAGKEVTMSVDGTRYFGGFVTQVIHQLAFPVDDTVTGGPGAVKTREFVLRGVDWNILFDKRVCYNKADPPSPHAVFAATVSDVDILTAFFADYIDLTGDGIDTTSRQLAMSLQRVLNMPSSILVIHGVTRWSRCRCSRVRSGTSTATRSSTTRTLRPSRRVGASLIRPTRSRPLDSATLNTSKMRRT